MASMLNCGKTVETAPNALIHPARNEVKVSLVRLIFERFPKVINNLFITTVRRMIH